MHKEEEKGGSLLFFQLFHYSLFPYLSIPLPSMTERARINVGGDKHQLDANYTTLINLPAQVYDQRTQDVETMAASYRITPQQAYILKLESEKKRRCK
jgi:hypothetical protein